jgi:hypothetical protein
VFEIILSRVLVDAIPRPRGSFFIPLPRTNRPLIIFFRNSLLRIADFLAPNRTIKMRPHVSCRWLQGLIVADTLRVMLRLLEMWMIFSCPYPFSIMISVWLTKMEDLEKDVMKLIRKRSSISGNMREKLLFQCADCLVPFEDNWPCESTHCALKSCPDTRRTWVRRPDTRPVIEGVSEDGAE